MDVKLSFGMRTQDRKAITLDADYGDSCTLNRVRVEDGKLPLAEIIIRAVNSHEAAQRLAEALAKAELILVSTDWIDTGGLKSEIHAALAEWEAVK